MSGKFRLVTRSDFDGLMCAILLNELNLIDEIKFVHPKDVQDGKVEITENDIITNLPYSKFAYLVFDHHSSEELRLQGHLKNRIIDAKSPSAARVVYNYYGGEKAFSGINQEMMTAVDKSDSAQFTIDEILYPEGWVLLNYLMDPRTGLGRFSHFRISNYNLMMELIGYCRTYTIAEILNLPDMKERIDLYNEHKPLALAQIQQCAIVHGSVVVLNMQDQEKIWVTNRFMVYALFPNASTSIHIMWDKEKKNTVLAGGKSIIDRSSKVNIGKLMLEYNGGGHDAAGTCRVPNEYANETLLKLINAFNAH